MQLKSIKLENIRSYTNQQVNFPEGSTLLSGDIGSGKSSILLAIEFALFGVKRKHLPGSSLLRHGAKQGSVELGFSIGEKEIIIKRFLKRGASDIKQESGFIITNGIKKEGTAIELKSDIIDILGYPKDMVSKSRDLVYRYTVYTPQEEMKQILFEDKEIRLDTLRKVFNIDKYKRIRENCDVYLKHLRERINLLTGKISDIAEKKKQKENYVMQIDEIVKKVSRLEPSINDIKGKVKLNREFISQIEADIKAFEELKKGLELKEVELKNVLELRVRNKKEIEDLETNIAVLQKDLSGYSELKIEDVKPKEAILLSLQKQIRELTTKIGQSELIIKQAEDTKKKILQIDQCPTCKQDVKISHKQMIESFENQRITSSMKAAEDAKIEEARLNTELEKIRKEIEEIRKRESEIKIIKLKKDNLLEKQKRVELLSLNMDKVKEKVGQINLEKIEISKKLKGAGDLEKEYNLLRSELNKLEQEERKLEIEKAELIKERSTLTAIISRLDAELKQKADDKASLEKVKELKHWLEELFVKLMLVMEKHVMAQVHAEFNELFQKWFSVLIEDENITVRLDDEFTPMIMQNGYETAVENLSGGEKTAVALSYRLSLNKVINDVISNIRTKDLIILDEPTDGFSTEQLDKIRDVLEELDMKQVIMVSHENKIESFVDNVIRLGKNEHVSNII
ncbi:MAG: hypothetical protein KJ601_03365 [Nanoarchaeota archaeon]|nr:hypothetical protein [Nanoarchaeota archaeon]